MKIISDFHDYYDFMMKYGIDHKIVYKRMSDNKIYVQESPKQNCFYGYSFCTGDQKYSLKAIGYCGEIIPMITISYTGCNVDLMGVKKNCYTVEELHSVSHDNRFDKNILENYLVNKRVELDKSFFELVEEKSYWPFVRTVKSNKYDRKSLIFNLDCEYLKTIFNKHKVPLFLMTGSAIVWEWFIKYSDSDKTFFDDKYGRCYFDVNLKDRNFPYRAEKVFQDIQMFISTHFVNDEMKVNPVSDRIKAESHGFDKFSFRKDKQLV